MEIRCSTSLYYMCRLCSYRESIGLTARGHLTKVQAAGAVASQMMCVAHQCTLIAGQCGRKTKVPVNYASGRWQSYSGRSHFRQEVLGRNGFRINGLINFGSALWNPRNLKAVSPRNERCCQSTWKRRRLMKVRNRNYPKIRRNERIRQSEATDEC